YDPDTGQLLTGTFMDYAMPRASDMPPLQSDYLCVPAPSNPLGVKGGSETGTIGPPAAIGNAVVDALWHLGCPASSLRARLTRSGGRLRQPRRERRKWGRWRSRFP